MENVRTFATMFSGGEIAGIGLENAGLRHLWGVELNPEIAEVARRNGFAVHVGDVRTFDFTKMPSPDWLHASPPCPNFSRAKANATETMLDFQMAEAVANAISMYLPEVFTLENVWKYRESGSFGHILRTLDEEGYHVHYGHYNMADFGVPQTRKRLFLIAVWDGGEIEPEPTHAGKWNGWYEAIADLVPELPETEFAPWQIQKIKEREPEFYHGFMARFSGEAAFIAEGEGPAFNVREMGRAVEKAFVVGGTQDGNGSSITAREQDEPFMTVAASHYKHAQRAYIVPGSNASSLTVKGANEPVRTISDTKRTGNLPRVIEDTGRVVRITPRALARFQTIPDWYALPENNKLACTIIGNAVPALFMETVARQVINN